MLPSSFAPFRHRGYRRVWLGAFASNIGTWMETVGVGIYVERTTGQAAWVGLVAAAGFVPSAIIGPFAGALADRLPRKAVLIGANAAAALLATVLTLTVAFDVATPALVALIVLANGCVGSLGFPAFMAILPELVPEEELPGALALSSAQWNLGRIVGPALAGIVIGLGGYEWAFAINALSFVAPVIALLPLTIPNPVKTATTSIFASVREGMSFARHEPGIRSVIGYFALNSFLIAPFIALVPSFAAVLTGDEDFGTSVLVTAQGVGAVIMALSLSYLVRRFEPRGVLRGVLLASPFALALYAVSPGVPFAAVAIVLLGGTYLGTLSTVNTIAQLRTPQALRGRVLSINLIILGSLYPIGSILQGYVGDQIGLRTTSLIAAGAMLVFLLVTGITTKRFAAALVGTDVRGNRLDGPDIIEPGAPTPGALPSGPD